MKEIRIVPVVRVISPSIEEVQLEDFMSQAAIEGAISSPTKPTLAAMKKIFALS